MNYELQSNLHPTSFDWIKKFHVVSVNFGEGEGGANLLLQNSTHK